MTILKIPRNMRVHLKLKHNYRILLWVKAIWLNSMSQKLIKNTETCMMGLALYLRVKKHFKFQNFDD